MCDVRQQSGHLPLPNTERCREAMRATLKESLLDWEATLCAQSRAAHGTPSHIPDQNCAAFTLRGRRCTLPHLPFHDVCRVHLDYHWRHRRLPTGGARVISPILRPSGRVYPDPGNLYWTPPAPITDILDRSLISRVDRPPPYVARLSHTPFPLRLDSFETVLSETPVHEDA